MAKSRRIFISVAEHSADVHAARLVAAIRAAHPDWELLGLTGPRLRAAGVETVFDFTAHAAMIAGIFKVIGTARRALAAAEASWREKRPDLVIVMDSSALHLRMAKAAKRLGLPVLYYIAPQTWASRPWRNTQIRKYVDKLACILPFEQEYFRGAGIDADFVGHPLFESLADERPDATRVAALRGDGEPPTVALLPGSRKHVIETMLPLQLDVIRQMQAAGHAVRPAVSCVDADREPLIRELIVQHGPEAEVITGDNASLLAAADLVLVASGTATLHVAAYRKPMVVMYDAGGWLRWPYRLVGRLAINLPHLCLVNILARDGIVPEYMPFVAKTAPIAETAGRLLTDSVWRDVMTQQLDALVAPLEASNASRRVLALIESALSAE